MGSPCAWSAALALVACAHSGQLAPAPAAATVPGRPRSAEETVDGVRTADLGQSFGTVAIPFVVK